MSLQLHAIHPNALSPGGPTFDIIPHTPPARARSTTYRAIIHLSVSLAQTRGSFPFLYKYLASPSLSCTFPSTNCERHRHHASAA